MNKNLNGDGWCFPMNLKTNKFILYVEKKNVTRPPLLNSNVSLPPQQVAHESEGDVKGKTREKKNYNKFIKKKKKGSPPRH